MYIGYWFEGVLVIQYGLEAGGVGTKAFVIEDVVAVESLEMPRNRLMVAGRGRAIRRRKERVIGEAIV